MDYTPCEHGNHEAGCMFCQAQSPTHTQQAITAYLADVPLPEGWTERPDQWGGTFYHDEEGWERAHVSVGGFRVWSQSRDWPAIPLPVLVRAAVQCHRLREWK